jgi:hypothetical protein
VKKKKKKRRKEKATAPSFSRWPKLLRPPVFELDGDSSPTDILSIHHHLFTSIHTSIMSFLFGGAPKMSSAEKIAAAETEVEMISDMFNR